MTTDKDHFIDLFRYTAWANGLIIETLVQYERAREAPAFEEAVELLSHLLRAQVVWLGRIQRTEDAQLPFWHRDPLEECAARSEESTEAWLRFLSDRSPEAFAASYAYHNSKGRPYSTSLRQIATHVVNHSTHHRSQIALLLRSMDIPPPPTDYIYYTR